MTAPRRDHQTAFPEAPAEYPRPSLRDTEALVRRLKHPARYHVTSAVGTPATAAPARPPQVALAGWAVVWRRRDKRSITVYER